MPNFGQLPVISSLNPSTHENEMEERENGNALAVPGLSVRHSPTSSCFPHSSPHGSGLRQERQPGVIVLERPEKMHKRRYRSIRIPRAVYERVIEEITI